MSTLSLPDRLGPLAWNAALLLLSRLRFRLEERVLRLALHVATRHLGSTLLAVAFPDPHPDQKGVSRDRVVRPGPGFCRWKSPLFEKRVFRVECFFGS